MADDPGTTRDRRAGAVAAASSVGLVVAWSSGFVGAELGERAGADPVTLLAWRFLVLAAGLVVLALVVRMRWPDRRGWVRHATLALLCQVGYLVLVFEGVEHGVDGGTTALIAALQPMLVATIAGRWLGEPTSAAMWLGMALGLIGVAVAVLGDVEVGDAPWPVYLLPVAGMLSLTVGTVLTRRARDSASLQQTITVQAVVTAAVLTVMAAVSGRAAPPADPGFWGAVAWLVVLASLGGYVLYVFVTRTRGATTVSVLLYLTPPTTMVWVLLLFGEPIGPWAIGGLLVSAAGVVLVLRGRRRDAVDRAVSPPRAGERSGAGRARRRSPRTP